MSNAEPKSGSISPGPGPDRFFLPMPLSPQGNGPVLEVAGQTFAGLNRADWPSSGVGVGPRKYKSRKNRPWSNLNSLDYLGN
jgi:hypothetical protein